MLLHGEAGGTECKDVVRHPLVPAGIGPRLPQMRAGNVDVCQVHPGRNDPSGSFLFTHFLGHSQPR